MQRLVQINIAGRIIPIEEDAYIIIKEYLTALERQFSGEEGRDEIIQDIEHRIAELFSIRLQAGSPAIDRSDVQKVIDTLGSASQLHDGPAGGQNYTVGGIGAQQQSWQRNQQSQYNQQYQYTRQRLYRNPYDKVLGGVCSGIANYFDVDAVILRLIFAVLFLTFGIGLLAYIIAWIVIPMAKTPEELRYMSGGQHMTFNDIKRNMGEEMNDLKQRGEQMSRELKDFFSKKK
jgi:phage shock protein PspC (stress-responsive transcriptional regulator)